MGFGKMKQYRFCDECGWYNKDVGCDCVPEEEEEVTMFRQETFHDIFLKTNLHKHEMKEEDIKL